MTVDDTTTAAKGKAALSDTQEIPAGSVAAPVPPYLDDDDDGDVLAARELDARTRRRARRITGLLALVAALGIGFYGGVLYQKNEGSSSSSNSPSGIASALRAAFAGRGGAGGGGGTGGGGATGASRFAGLGRGGGSSTAVVGTVSAVANGTLYVSQGSSSALVKVVTNPQSSVTTSQTAPLSAVQPGDTVVISGAKQKDGSFMASSIRDSGTASAGGGGASIFGG